jgi:hypothetical protein
MPLLRDRLDETKLKSIPFGNDRPDGGSSNQPYIQNPIDVTLGAEQGTLAYNVLGNDFLLRGGALGATAASANDVIRLTKFFNPFAKGASLNGALFVAKQAILARQNADVLDGRSRTYFPTSTIAQASLSAFGFHLDKDGLNPFKAGYYGSGDTGYYITTYDNDRNNEGGSSRNRLQLLYSVKRLGDESSNITVQRRRLSANIQGRNIAAAAAIASIGTLGLLDSGVRNPLAFAGLGALSALPLLIGTGINFAKKDTQIKLAKQLYSITGVDDNINLISYGGGPGSFLGIGNTNLKIWNPLQFKNNSFPNYTDIVKNEEYPDNPDFYLTPSDGNAKTLYSLFREIKLNTSKTTFSRKRNGTDKILNPNLSISSDQVILGDGDIINFYFELINNNDTTKNTKIPLRAYIEDFGDNFTGEWDAFKYMGRAENFYRYKGFTRDFNINFIVPTLSRTDLITNYQKLNALTWLTMPDYSDVGYIRGNLAYFTMGDYFNRAVIVMRNITFSPIMEMGFDINRDEGYNIFEQGTDLYTGQLPKGIKVSCTMTPLTQNTGIVEENNKDLFYTPQRGEAFIGNRTHVIKDRPDTIGKQYVGEENIKAAFKADNPEQSKIFTITDAPITPDNSSNVPTANRSLMRG